jgi:hypothetical protein
LLVHEALTIALLIRTAKNCKRHFQVTLLQESDPVHSWNCRKFLLKTGGRLRYIQGCTFVEVAKVLGVSTTEAKRSCEPARLWLQREDKQQNFDACTVAASAPCFSRPE